MPVVEIERTSKRGRQHEAYGAEPDGNNELIGGNTELIDDNNAKRQKVNHQERVPETLGLSDFQDVKSNLHAKEPIKATSMGVLEPAEQSTRGRKRASMTIDKFFSQYEGSRAKKLQLTPEVSDTKTGKGLAGQANEPPYVDSSTVEIRTKEPVRVVADSSQSVEADVVFSQLIVRKDAGMVSSPTTPTRGSAPNFKRFRKKVIFCLSPFGLNGESLT